MLETVVSAGVNPAINAGADADTGPGDWPDGARVLAVWPIEQIYWYPATVKRSTKSWVEVNYDDGQKAPVKASEVMKIDIAVGSRVFHHIKEGTALFAR